MKFLRKIILENFQSHKYTELEFIQGLNVILGPSDAGKTAIIRGLKWALYNEPSGDYFIREGETNCSVTIEFSDNTILKRVRTRSKNMYLLTKKNGEEFHFEGFGTSVPNEIISEIGIQKNLLDDSESKAINLGEQLEGAFLLSERSSVRASAIGRIVGVNIIDDALKDTLKDLRNYTLYKKNLEGNADKIEEELNNYKYLEKELENIKILKYKKEQLNLKFNRKELLKKHLILFDNVSNDKILVKSDLEQYSKIKDSEKIIKNLGTLIINQKLLINKKNNLDKCYKEIKASEKLLVSLKHLSRIGECYNNIFISNDLILKLVSIKNTYEVLIKDIKNTELIINNLVGLERYEEVLFLILELNEYITKLKKYYLQYKDLKSRIESGLIYLEQFQDANIYNDLIIKMESTIIALNKVNRFFSTYSEIKSSINNEKLNFNKSEKELKIIRTKYQELLKLIKICPYCFSNINEENIDDITSNL